jgi:hypothetical protein
MLNFAVFIYVSMHLKYLCGQCVCVGSLGGGGAEAPGMYVRGNIPRYREHLSGYAHIDATHASQGV